MRTIYYIIAGIIGWLIIRDISSNIAANKMFNSPWNFGGWVGGSVTKENLYLKR